MIEHEPNAPDYYYSWIDESQLNYKQRLQTRIMIGYLVARGFSEWGAADSPETEGCFLLVISKQARFTIDFTDVADGPPKLVLTLGEGLGKDFKVAVGPDSIHDDYECLRKMLP